MDAICKKENLPLTVVGYGSLWRLKFLEEIPYSELLFTLMRLKGIHVLDGFPCFMTDAHTEEDVDTMIAKFGESIAEMTEAGFFKAQSAAPVVSLAKAASPSITNANMPPVEGAKLGRDKDGNPAWFLMDENNPGKYLQIKLNGE
jgi:hypothetical protein